MKLADLLLRVCMFVVMTLFHKYPKKKKKFLVVTLKSALHLMELFCGTDCVKVLPVTFRDLSRDEACV